MSVQNLAAVKGAACGCDRNKEFNSEKSVLRCPPGTSSCGTSVLGSTVPEPAAELKLSQGSAQGVTGGPHGMQLLDEPGKSVLTPAGSAVARIGIKSQITSEARAYVRGLMDCFQHV